MAVIHRTRKTTRSDKTMAIVLWPNPRLNIVVRLFEQFVYTVLHWSRRQWSDQWVVGDLQHHDTEIEMLTDHVVRPLHG